MPLTRKALVTWSYFTQRPHSGVWYCSLSNKFPVYCSHFSGWCCCCCCFLSKEITFNNMMAFCGMLRFFIFCASPLPLPTPRRTAHRCVVFLSFAGDGLLPCALVLAIPRSNSIRGRVGGNVVRRWICLNRAAFLLSPPPPNIRMLFTCFPQDHEPGPSSIRRRLLSQQTYSRKLAGLSRGRPDHLLCFH